MAGRDPDQTVRAAREGQAAADRLRQLLADVDAAGRLAGVADVHAQIAEGAKQAADALGHRLVTRACDRVTGHKKAA